MCLGLIHDLGHGDRVVFRQTRTGLYYANKFYRLSSPLDVLRVGVLTPLDRLRLGWLAVRVKGVRDWRALEQVTAKDWLISLAGRDVYRVVWEPLLNGKFGRYADTISAVWFWNKIALRGGSHGNGGKETLAYYGGGFGSLIEDLAQAIGDLGGTIFTGEGVTGVSVADGRVVSVETTSRRSIAARAVLATPALPLIADMFKPHLSAAADAWTSPGLAESRCLLFFVGVERRFEGGGADVAQARMPPARVIEAFDVLPNGVGSLPA